MCVLEALGFYNVYNCCVKVGIVYQYFSRFGCNNNNNEDNSICDDDDRNPWAAVYLVHSFCLPACRYHHGDAKPEQNGCYRHCVDENIERRNHYLDLAGIENYTSKFGPGNSI